MPRARIPASSALDGSKPRRGPTQSNQINININHVQTYAKHLQAYIIAGRPDYDATRDPAHMPRTDKAAEGRPYACASMKAKISSYTRWLQKLYS